MDARVARRRNVIRINPGKNVVTRRRNAILFKPGEKLPALTKILTPTRRNRRRNELVYFDERAILHCYGHEGRDSPDESLCRRRLSPEGNSILKVVSPPDSEEVPRTNKSRGNAARAFPNKKEIYTK